MGGHKPEDSTEESGTTIPIQGIPMRMAGSFYALIAWKGTAKVIVRFVQGVFFEKC